MGRWSFLMGDGRLRKLAGNRRLTCILSLRITMLFSNFD